MRLVLKGLPVVWTALVTGLGMSVLLAGCQHLPRPAPKAPPTSPAAPSVPTPPQPSTPQLAPIYPPRAKASESVTSIAVRVIYGRLRFPIADRAGLSERIAQAINDKLSRYRVQATLVTSDGDGAGRPMLTVHYSETRSNATVVTDPKTREFTPTVIRLEMDLQAPWLPSGWHRTIEEEKTLGRTAQPLRTDADLRDATFDDLVASVTRVSFPFAAVYEGPKVVASIKVGDALDSLTQSGNTVAGTDYAALRVYQLPGNGKLRHVASAPGAQSPVFVARDLLAATTLDGGVNLFSYRPGGGLRHLSRLKLHTGPGEPETYSLAGRGGVLYATSESKLLEIGATDPRRPHVLRKATLSVEGAKEHGIALASSDILCITVYPKKLVIVRATPAGLEEVGAAPLSAGEDRGIGHLSVVARGRYVYVLWDSCSVMCFDISDPQKPRQAFQFFTPGYPRGLALSGDRLLVADEDGGIYVLDVSDPGQPRGLGTVEVGGQTGEITCDGTLAAVAVQSRSPEYWTEPTMLKCVRLL